jgi:hypothetical protein
MEAALPAGAALVTFARLLYGWTSANPRVGREAAAASDIRSEAGPATSCVLHAPSTSTSSSRTDRPS